MALFVAATEIGDDVSDAAPMLQHMCLVDRAAEMAVSTVCEM